MKSWLLPVLTGLALSALIGWLALPWAIKGQRQQDALESRAIQTQATVMATMPQNHAQCSYDFVLENRHYQAIGGGCADRPVGSRITVYYLPDDPNVSTNGEPGTNDTGGWILVIWLMLVPPAFAAFVIYQAFRKNLIRRQTEG